VNDVQELIDQLAQRLQRPVGVDDRQFRAIAYSSHADEIDSVRRTSILGRRAPEAVTRWLQSLGLMNARDVVRVPSNPELEMVARVSVPVRFHDRLLGFLWLVEQDQPLSEADLEASRRTAESVAQELFRERQQTGEERQREARWVRAILNRSAADPDVHGLPGVAPDALYAAAVLTVGFPDGAPAPLGVDVRITEAIDQSRRALAPRHQLAAMGAEGALIVLSASSPEEVRRSAEGLLRSARAEVSDLADARVVLGVGGLATTIDELPVAAAQAWRAIQLADALPEADGLVLWSELGVMRLLVELVGDRDPGRLLPASLRRILADHDSELLIRSLSAYLEHAGDVPAAAADLFVHRSSLYNRLRRIEEVAGVNLRSGADRLELHLGLRLLSMGRRSR
jgi:DNA-binding PucR family transcriptional regulator